MWDNRCFDWALMIDVKCEFIFVEDVLNNSSNLPGNGSENAIKHRGIILIDTDKNVRALEQWLSRCHTRPCVLVLLRPWCFYWASSTRLSGYDGPVGRVFWGFPAGKGPKFGFFQRSKADVDFFFSRVEDALKTVDWQRRKGIFHTSLSLLVRFRLFFLLLKRFSGIGFPLMRVTVYMPV